MERELCIYLPPGYSSEAEPFPVLWDLAAFTNAGPGHTNWRLRGENLPERLDRLIGTGALRPLVVAMPDCFTYLGGNQYINSPGTGRYADYLVGELLPFLNESLNVIDSPRGRGLFGTSSGGYGALVLSMLHPGVWGAVAAHAPDVGFEWVYRPGLAVACRVLENHNNDVAAFLSHFWQGKRISGDDYTTLMTLAMASSYDPNPGNVRKIRLPVRAGTCELLSERWAQWLKWDPLQLIELHHEALSGLELLYLDVGRHDEYHIQFGCRQLTRRLDELGVNHHFSEFEGTHRGLDMRLDVSLPLLADALSAA